MIPIRPPIAEGERAFVFTLRGTDTADVREINPSLVVISNETDRIAPMLFVVGPTNLTPTWLTLIRQSLQLLRGSS